MSRDKALYKSTVTYLLTTVVRRAGDGFEIFVRPFYAVAVVDVIRHYGWQDIWYLYSNDEGSRCLLQAGPDLV